MLVAIAWRNLWRNKLRSAVIILAIAIGIIGGIVSDGLMTGMSDQRVNAAINNEVSNIQIQNPEFLLNNEIQYTLPAHLQLVKKIKTYPEVKGVSARLECDAMASSASAGSGIVAYGVVPADEVRVSNIHNHIIQGNYLNDKQRIPAVISKKLSEKLDLKLNDRIIITLADTSGTITSGTFRIIGIYKTSNAIFDASAVFVRKKDLAKILNISPTTSHQIAIRLNDNSKTGLVVKKITRDFPKSIEQKTITVRSWQQIAPLLQSMIALMNMFSYIFMIIILMALSLGIVNTMTMAIMERTREIGMLMALGLNKRKTFSLIMLETVFLSLVGALLGFIISFFIAHHFAVYGFDLSSVSKGMNSIGYSAIVYFRVDVGFYITTILMVVVIAILSAISPARKALKLQPANAIRDNK